MAVENMHDWSYAAAWEAVWLHGAGPIAIVDLDGNHVDVNPAMCRLLGYSRQELLRLTPVDVTHPDDVILSKEFIEKIIAGFIDNFRVEKRLISSGGDVVWVLVTNSLVRDPDGSPRFVISQFHDITARHESEVLWHRTLTNAPVGMALLDLDGRWTEVNDRLCEMVGYSRDELLGSHYSDLAYDDDHVVSEAALADLAEGRKDSETLEIRIRHRDGDPFWMLIRFSAVPGADDTPAYLVAQSEILSSDVRTDAERVRQLTHMALHDPLTGLANRALLTDRFEQELAALSESGGVLAVLMIDLDKFKPVNDEYGHRVGDELLITAAKELGNVVRPTDTVARIGGDEFAVLSRVDSYAAAEHLRERVSDSLNTAINTGAHSINIRASVGFASTQSPAATAKTLLNDADRDMYMRKTAGR